MRLKQYLAAQSPYHGTSQMKFEEVTGEFLLDAETTLKPSTHERYRHSINRMGATFAGRWWDSVTKDALLEYIADRKREGVKISTIQRDLTALSQAAEYAIEREWAVTNPVTLLPKRPLRYKTPVFKRPGPKSLALGLSSCHGNMEPLARFLLATGMRMNEGVTLERGQIDKARRTATLTETKNGNGRTVELNADAMAILNGMPAYAGTQIVFPAVNQETKVAAAYKGPKTAWQEAQKRAMRRAEKEGWRFDRFGLHALRHIYAIDYLANGGNLYKLQLQLGHGSIRQTEQYLQFLSPDEQLMGQIRDGTNPGTP